jgi:hypothetical protein
VLVGIVAVCPMLAIDHDVVQTSGILSFSFIAACCSIRHQGDLSSKWTKSNENATGFRRETRFFVCLPHFAWDEAYYSTTTLAYEGDTPGLLSTGLLYSFAQSGHSFGRLLLDGQNDIAAAQAGSFCRAVGCYFEQQNAAVLIQPVTLHRISIKC